MTTDYLPNATKRLRLIYTVNGNRKATTLRVLETTDETDLQSIFEAYNASLLSLYTMSGLVPVDRISEIVFNEAHVAEKDQDMFVPISLTPIANPILDGVGTPTVRDMLAMASITGRAESGAKCIFYFMGISSDLAAGTLSENYGDMKLDTGELGTLQSWFTAYWSPGSTLFDGLTGPGNSPLMFIRPRLNVRFSAKMTNKLRKR